MNSSTLPQKPRSGTTGSVLCALNRLAALLGKTAGIAARAGTEAADAALSSPESAGCSDERGAVLSPVERAVRPITAGAAEVGGEILQAYGDIWDLLSARSGAEER